MIDRLRTGVCGLGSIGFRHARVLSQKKDVDLFLCEVTTSCLDRARSLANVLGTTDSFDKLLEWQLDGLVLATPEDLHVAQAISALQNGVPVLIEKPDAKNSREAMKLLKALQDTGGKALVGYLLRFSNCMRLAKSLLDEGLIGTPLSFQIMTGAYETLSLAKSRFSSDCRNRLFSDYSHEWDYLNWFLGDVNTVIATSHQREI